MNEVNATRGQGSGIAIESTASGVVAAFRRIRKHWPIVVASVVLAAGVSILFTRSQVRIYQSVAMLEFDPNPIRPLSRDSDGATSFTSYWDNQEYYETQLHIITSERVLNAVARNTGLANEPDFWRKSGSDAATPTLDALGQLLRARTSVELVKNSRLVRVKVEDSSPQRAKRLCEAIINTYTTQNLEKSVAATSDAVVWLNGQVDHFKEELDSNENALYAFKQRNDLPSTSLNEASNIVRAEMMAFDDALTKTKTRKQEMVARRDELTKVLATDPGQVPASELLGSAFLGSQRSLYYQYSKERGQLIAEGKGENHPAVRRADEQLTQARAALITEIKNIQGALERDVSVLARQEAGESALYEDARRRAVELNLKEIEYHRLDRNREQNEKLYAMLLQRMKEADLARMMNVNNVRVVESPLEPKNPIRPNASANIGAGLALGVVLGILLAWLRDQLDNTLKTPEDIEQKLQLTFLGLLPVFDMNQQPGRGKRGRRRTPLAVDFPSELIAHERPTSGVAEAARALRTNLMFMNPDEPFRRILVTSAAPGEGKTTVAVSLAIALAQGGQRVCIVDCDLRRPRLHRIFDRVGDMGVTNVLVSEATMLDVALPTKVQNLYSVPSGPTPPNAADVLHSAKFRKFLDDLSNEFDRVIIDSPPVIAVTDAAIISTVADGVVFVTRAQKSSKTLSRQGLRTLHDVDARVIGAVLNSVDLNSAEYSYYPQYYYYRNEHAYTSPAGAGGAATGGGASDGDGDGDAPAAPH